MPKISSDKTKITCRLYDGDTERLRRFYPNVGYSEIIRELVHQHIQKLEDKLAAKVKFNLPEPEEKL